MLVERFTTDVQPRWKKGHPPHSTTGVASSNSSQASQPPGKTCCTGIPGSMSAIAMPSSGTVRIALTQNRRVMSRSSGFSSWVAVTVRGSSAIPQMGQLPGWSRTISGCMGQVYSVLVSATGVSGSSAIPQLGHGPGFSWCTSGHIGHTYAEAEDFVSLAGGAATLAHAGAGDTVGFGASSVTRAGPAGRGFE